MAKIDVSDDEIISAIKDTLSSTIRYWYIIISSVIIFSFIAVVLMRITPPYYMASVTVGANDKQLGQADSSSLSASNALSVLTGSSGNGLSGDLKNMAFLMTSPRMGEKILSSSETSALFFSNIYNPDSNLWHAPDDVPTKLKSILRRIGGMSPWLPPDSSEVADILKGQVNLTQVAGTDLWTIQIKDSTPERAEEKLEWLVNNADDMIKSDEKKNIGEDISFLKAQLQETASQYQRDQLIALLAAQSQKEMLLNRSGPFSYKAISHILSGKNPAGPKLTTFLIGGIMGGLLIGISITFTLYARKKTRDVE